jgi:CDP-4-dehydro-6-deoxyglucose reductase
MPANHIVRIVPHECTVSAPEDLPVLSAAQLAGLPLPHSCRSGRCGSCRARLLSGQIDYPAGPPLGLSPQERQQGFVLLCQACARSDLVVEARLIQSAASADIKTLPTRILRREQLAPDVMRVVLRLPAVESLDVQAGQYLDVLLAGGQRRSYSVANAPATGHELELHVRRVPGGAFSEPLFATLREGAMLRVEGPLGRFLYQPGEEPVLFIAGGTGFAPLKAMLTVALAQPGTRPLTLYWGARDAAGLYELALVRAWAAAHARLRVHTVLSDAAALEGEHRHGWVHEAVLQDHPDLAPFAIYAAGPPAMIAAIEAGFPAHGARPERLHLDSFDYAVTS